MLVNINTLIACCELKKASGMHLRDNNIGFPHFPAISRLQRIPCQDVRAKITKIFNLLKKNHNMFFFLIKNKKKSDIILQVIHKKELAVKGMSGRVVTLRIAEDASAVINNY